jgi:RimJ/RimL family protein N-acetyltransferase
LVAIWSDRDRSIGRFCPASEATKKLSSFLLHFSFWNVIRSIELNMTTTPDSQAISLALDWIVSLLGQYGIPYQVVGGLAAQAYGAKRPLVDIDLYIPMEQAQAALAELQPYLVRSPRRHRSASWDLVFIVLDYHGVSIEIGDSSSDPRFYNRRDQRWEQQVIDYTASQRVMLYDVDVDVMPRDELLRYKTMLDRPVDRADIRAMAPSPWDIPEDAPHMPQVIALTLDLEAFNDYAYDEVIAALKGKGFRFTSLAELRNTEEMQRSLYALNDTTAMETPGSNGEHVWPSFEDFRDDVCQMDWFNPGGQIVAIDTATGTWAAMSAIARFGENDYAENLHTGVDRRYRGRKLAQAMLVLALRYARDVLKVKSARAEESVLNLPLLAIYHELGYLQMPGVFQSNGADS